MSVTLSQCSVSNENRRACCSAWPPPLNWMTRPAGLSASIASASLRVNGNTASARRSKSCSSGSPSASSTHRTRTFLNSGSGCFVLQVATRRNTRLASRAFGSAPKSASRETSSRCTAFHRGSAACGSGDFNSHFRYRPRPEWTTRDAGGIPSSVRRCRTARAIAVPRAACRRPCCRCPDPRSTAAGARD